MDLEPTLQGARVALVPLQAAHRDGLVAAASEGELWTLKVTTVPGPDTVDDYIAKALAGRRAGTMAPFATTVDGRVVGSTRFWRIDPANRALEIGHTWIGAPWQRSFVNTEAKLLMLRHAFEALGCVRVQFMTDALNTRSRAAIARLGAVEEGLLRSERFMPNGRLRDTVVFSIIEREWPAVKARLTERLGIDA